MSRPQPPADVSAALAELGVPGDRIDALTAYVEILDRWRQRINLIGPASVDQIWRRHVLDSAQLWPYLTDPDAPLLDLGAGAGLPGLVLAIIGARDVTLVDADQRKTVFLMEAARHVGVAPDIRPTRFDAALASSAFAYRVVTARAVAPLVRLAPVLVRALAPDGYALLHKGAAVENELTELRKSWTIQFHAIPSITDPAGVVLKIWGLKQIDR